MTIKITDIPAGRTVDFSWTASQSNGTAMVFAAEDKVRFKLAAKPGDTPLIDLVSGVASGGGSSVTIATLSPAAGTVRLGQGDTADFEGVYNFELNLVDDSETEPADAIKPICRGRITFLKSQGGGLGLS